MRAGRLDITNALAGQPPDLRVALGHDGRRGLFDQTHHPDVGGGGGQNRGHVAQQAGFKAMISQQGHHVGTTPKGMRLEGLPALCKRRFQDAVVLHDRADDP